MLNTTVVFSGLLSLLGGFFGALLARRTDYEKWLRQEQSQSFAAFIQRVLDFQTKAIDIIHGQLSYSERDIAITELFMEVEIYKQIVRLYLRPTDRGRVDALSNELRAAFNPAGDQGKRARDVDRVLKEIQLIFEATLDSHHTKFWNKVMV